MNTQFYAYIHCKPDGVPFYVGKGTGKRLHDFINGRSNHHKNVTAKYGKENIEAWKFDCDSERKAFDLEIYLIAHYKRIGIKLCNKTGGGDGGSNPSEQTRAKLSAAGKGRIHTSETRAKIASWHIGKKASDKTRKKLSLVAINRNHPLHSDATKAKISASAMGNTRWLGKKHSAETRAKMSAAAMGKPKSLESRAKLSAALIGNTRRKLKLC